MKHLGFNNQWIYALLMIMGGFFLPRITNGQLGLYQQESSPMDPSATLSYDLIFKNDFNLPFGNVSVRKGTFYIRTDFNSKYRFGTAGSGMDFTYTLNFDLVPIGLPGATPVSHSLKINNNKPVAYYFKNLGEFFGASSNGFTIEGYRLASISASNVNLPTGYENEVKFYVGYEAEYKINPQGMQFKVAKVEMIDEAGRSNTKTAKFTWSQLSSNTHYVPGFELQIMKLRNTNFTHVPIPGNEEQKIQIDWERALSYYIEKPSNNPEESIYLTLGQGSGVYVWRVRAIGTVLPNGIGDSRNWGPWAVGSPLNGKNGVNFLTPLKNFHYFIFEDPDEDKNYSFNRVFSEETKTKEKTTYATGLQNIRQEQVYLSSQDVTVITQTLQDKNGRNAISTIPVPKLGKVYKYEKGLTQNESGSFYRPENYDSDSKLNNPDKINEGTGSLFGYYSDFGDDVRIPTTDGYPFTRTLYSSDGTSRVTETSGIGRVHMVGDQSQGMGRTTRMAYGSASEEELTRLFGDEAPNPEYVQKTITHDPNNTATITYTTLDGKVIATGLAFTELEDSLMDLENDFDTMKVTNTFSVNTTTSHAIVSTKKIALTQPSKLDLLHKIKCESLLELCANGGITCYYRVRFTVYDHLGAKVFRSSDTPISLNSDNCTGEYITTGATTPVLAPGEYLIEKKLFKDFSDSDSPLNSIKGELDPIANWIRSRVDGAICFQQLLDFYNELIPYSEGHNGLPIDITVFDADQEVMNSSHLPITDYNTPSTVVITNSCCKIELDISCFPPLSCPTNDEINAFAAANPSGVDGLQVNFNYHDEPENTEFLFDFEGYAVSLIKQCDESISSQTAYDLFYDNMTGWHEPGIFNHMVHQMLTDKYSYGGFGENAAPDGGCTTPAYKDITDSLKDFMGVDTLLCNPDLNNPIEGTRYKCFDLIQCWENVVQQFINFKCKGVEFDSALNQSGKNIAELFDEQKNGDKTEFDEHFDNNFKGFFLLKWWAKRKLSKELRKNEVNIDLDVTKVAPLPQFNAHLVYQFLNCAGFEFADVIDSGDPDYPINSKATGDDSPYKADSCFYSISGDFTTGNKKYDPDAYFSGHLNGVSNGDEWAGLTAVLSNKNGVIKTAKLKELFPLIKHPVYAFKYFEYEHGSDNAIEALNCFRDPNLCLNASGDTINCCGTLPNGGTKPCKFKTVGRINCPFTSAEWTTKQRFIFYKKLTDKIRLYGEGNDPNDLPVWEDFDPEITCDWARDDIRWVMNKADTTAVSAMNYIPKTWFEDWYPGEPSDSVRFVNMAGETVSTISMVEREAINMRVECEGSCEVRRDEFKKAVIKMLTDRCYVIDECKASLDDNVVPMKDVEAMTDSVVEKCKIVCKITTYACSDDAPCRKINSAITTLGDNDFEMKLEMGVGGSGDCPTDPFRLLDCTGQPDLSYQEYVLWLMSKNWNLDLEIQSKCNAAGEYDPNYNGPPWYWKNKGKIEVYDPPLCTTPGDNPTVQEAEGNPFIIPRADGKKQLIRKTSAAIAIDVEVEN